MGSSRAPLLEEHFTPLAPTSSRMHERRQLPLHVSLYAASAATLAAALYLFFEGLALLQESDKQSPWRPGSNLWGYIVEAAGLLLLWPGIVGVIGCVLKHPVCLGAVRACFVLHQSQRLCTFLPSPERLAQQLDRVTCMRVAVCRRNFHLHALGGYCSCHLPEK